MNYKVLYNPLAGKVNDTAFLEELKTLLPDDTFELSDVTKQDVKSFLKKDVKKGEGVILVGGDGTINHFVNDMYGEEISVPLYYYPGGSGNDFWTDIGRKKGDKPVELTQYMKYLPTVTVEGKDYKFINGVGYGIDGYCCEVGDKLKAEGNENINYAGIAVKGLLFHFKPRNGEVIVDGKSYKFSKVWIAPTMFGSHYGGGMIPTPAQDRGNSEHTFSICLMYGGKLKTLMTFPSIFKGEHVKKTKLVKVLSGKEITVKFAEPCALQIDGETHLNVSEYTVKQ